MKYFNLVFIKHGQSNKQYVFQLPMELEVTKQMIGKVAVCNTRRGQERGTFASENIIVPERAAKAICEACGGSFPPAKVVGRVQEEVKMFGQHFVEETVFPF